MSEVPKASILSPKFFGFYVRKLSGTTLNIMEIYSYLQSFSPYFSPFLFCFNFKVSHILRVLISSSLSSLPVHHQHTFPLSLSSSILFFIPSSFLSSSACMLPFIVLISFLLASFLSVILSPSYSPPLIFFSHISFHHLIFSLY